MEKADAERKKNKHLHNFAQSHDHMMVVVGPVNDKQPYCVGCRRIRWEYEHEKAKLDERDRYKEAKKWIETAKQTEKAVEGQWKLKEEDVQRRENREKLKFKHGIDKLKRRFQLRKKLSKKGKSEEEIQDEIKKNEPKIYTGKARAKQTSKAEARSR